MHSSVPYFINSRTTIACLLTLVSQSVRVYFHRPIIRRVFGLAIQKNWVSVEFTAIRSFADSQKNSRFQMRIVDVLSSHRSLHSSIMTFRAWEFTYRFSCDNRVQTFQLQTVTRPIFVDLLDSAFSHAFQQHFWAFRVIPEQHVWI